MRKGQSVLVRIPEENDLQSSLAHELPEVALGVTTGAKLMAVQDLFRVFSNGYNQRALQLSSELLKLISNDGHLSIFNNAIEKLIERGPYLSRVDSQEFGKVLMELTRRFGDELSAEQVFQMVVRGENISSAGLDGLSGLYDGFPDHAIKLDLSEFFDAKGYHELSWYCQFRQAHKALNSVTIWDRISGLQTQFKTRAGALTIADEDRDYCYRKWPNRGDVVYLHALSLPSP